MSTDQPTNVDLGRLLHRALAQHDAEAQHQLAQLEQHGMITGTRRPATAPPPAPGTPATPSERHPAQARQAVAAAFDIALDDPAVHAYLDQTAATPTQSPTPAFAPSPAQQAGNAGTPGPAPASIDRGAQLYREHKQRSTSTWTSSPWSA